MKKSKTIPKGTPTEEAQAVSEPSTDADATGSEVILETPPHVREALEELKAKAAKAEEHWERLLRTTAEFDNFRKRAAREKEEAVRYANQNLLDRLLPVLDSFDMAVASANAQDDGSCQSLKDGVNLILQQLRAVLTEAGLEEIDAQGKAFDPNLHEAVSQVETEAVEEGHVFQQLRKGYLLRDRLVRPASVVVAKKPGS